MTGEARMVAGYVLLGPDLLKEVEIGQAVHAAAKAELLEWLQAMHEHREGVSSLATPTRPKAWDDPTLDALLDRLGDELVDAFWSDDGDEVLLVCTPAQVRHIAALLADRPFPPPRIGGMP